MINVLMGNNTNRKTVIVNPNTSIRKALEDNGMEVAGKTYTLNSRTLSPDDYDKTFTDLGVTDRCYLLCVAKADNA